MQQAVSSIHPEVLAGGGGMFGGPGRVLTGGPPPKGTASSPVVVHVGGVAPAAAAALSGGVPGATLPFAAKAMKVIDAFEKTFKGMGSPWGKLASQYLDGLLGAVKNPMKETAAAAQKLVSQVATEITFGKNLAAAAAQGRGSGTRDCRHVHGPGSGVQIDSTDHRRSGPGVPGRLALTPSPGGRARCAAVGAAADERTCIAQESSAGTWETHQRRPVQGHPVPTARRRACPGGRARAVHPRRGGRRQARKQLFKQIQAESTALGVQGMEGMYGMPKGMQQAMGPCTASRSGSPCTPTPRRRSRRSTASTARPWSPGQGRSQRGRRGRAVVSRPDQVHHQPGPDCAPAAGQEQPRTGMTLSGYGSDLSFPPLSHGGC